MYAYYLQKGHSLESLLSLSNLEKNFYNEAMIYAQEQEYEKYKSMFGK